MYLPKNLKLFSLLFSTFTFVVPVLAHQVEVSKDVGATIHLEPNDTPRAGKPTLTWFALTRKGGKVIPLAQCKCELEIYAQPYRKGDNPIYQPRLKTVSAEGYQDIPAADITFPRVGGYELILKGSPVVSGDFTPFELRFPITVAR